MIGIAAVKKEKQALINFFKQYEYEIILLIFLLLRFVFKNIPDFAKYFTEQPIFGLSGSVCIVSGAAVVLAVCVFLARAFGSLVRKNGIEFEKPVLFLAAIFFACPASLPFLFDSGSLSGTQMLYPFALFILSVGLINMRYGKWLVPLICAVYFIPAVFTSEPFFSALRKGAILYVPLILLFLFLDKLKGQLEPSGSKTKSKERKKDSSVLFYTGLIASAGSYVCTLARGKSFSENFFGTEQRLNGYFIICLLITAPALTAAGAVLHNAVKNKFPAPVFNAIRFSPVLMLLLCVNNYYGLWVPFLVISLFSAVFFGIRYKNPAMLSAVRTTGDYLSLHKFLFIFVLMAMASFSNVTSSFLSAVFRKIFETIPY